VKTMDEVLAFALVRPDARDDEHAERPTVAPN
jgi:hypothetical protein